VLTLQPRFAPRHRLKHPAQHRKLHALIAHLFPLPKRFRENTLSTLPSSTIHNCSMNYSTQKRSARHKFQRKFDSKSTRVCSLRVSNSQQNLALSCGVLDACRGRGGAWGALVRWVVPSSNSRGDSAQPRQRRGPTVGGRGGGGGLGALEGNFDGSN
jgi:hypothetical protein